MIDFRGFSRAQARNRGPSVSGRPGKTANTDGSGRSPVGQDRRQLRVIALPHSSWLASAAGGGAVRGDARAAGPPSRPSAARSPDRYGRFTTGRLPVSAGSRSGRGSLPVALLCPQSVPHGSVWLAAWALVTAISVADDWTGVACRSIPSPFTRSRGAGRCLDAAGQGAADGLVAAAARSRSPARRSPSCGAPTSSTSWTAATRGA